MRAEWANRIVFLLACAGIFIALVMGIAHLSGAQLPCGAAQSGCDEVGKPEYSRLFGIPIAFFGLALYLAIALGALLRAVRGPEGSATLGNVIWAMTASGTLVSMGLTAHSVNTLNATCSWCIASAVAMTLALLAHSIGIIGNQAGQRERESQAPAHSPHPNPLPEGEGVAAATPSLGSYVGVLLIAATAGGGYGGWLAFRAEKALTGGEIQLQQGAPLVLPRNHVYGRQSAPITIVEFSDLYCPTCRALHKRVLERVDGPLKGKVRLVLRHYPIARQHPHATSAALLSEWAGDKGKFWEFVHLAFETEDADAVEPLIGHIEALGLDGDAAAELLRDEEARRPYLERVAEDMATAFRYGVNSTPHWFILYPDGKAVWAVGTGILSRMDGHEFRRYSQSLSR